MELLILIPLRNIKFEIEYAIKINIMLCPYIYR